MKYLIIALPFFVLAGCGQSESSEPPPERSKTPGMNESIDPPLATIRVNGNDYTPMRKEVPVYLYERTGDAIFGYDASKDVFCAKVASEIEVHESFLGAIIYGTTVNNVLSETGGKYSWTSADGLALKTGTLKSPTLADIDYFRHGEIWGAIRKHWREKDGWCDEVYKIPLGGRVYPAAKCPETPSEWLDDPAIVVVRYPVPNTPAGIKDGKAIMKDCATHVVNTAYQLGTKNLLLELHLDL